MAGFTVIGLLTRRHFDRVGDALALTPEAAGDGEGEETPSEVSHLAIVPIANLNRASMRALAQYWTAWGNHLPLEVVESPYRAVVAPTIAYIEALHAQRPELTLTVIVPELVVRHWWQRGLHDNTAPRLRRALEPLSTVIVTSVPFHVS